ncbi:MAG: ankyrin repeat domain-containing protein [Candidatus Poribacteria bacterium]|nr:ankyrin repeat domain-containing protein [Candidatus Poribacteria bacterium]
MKNKKALGESLITAAKRGDMTQVRELVENGADPNYSWIPPFMWAYFERNVDIAKYLIEQGGNVNHDAFSEGVLLSFAARDGELRFCEYLIDVGADVNHAMPKGGETPLHNAAEANQLSAIDMLIEHGAEVNQRSKSGESELEFGPMDGETPLHIAAALASVGVIRFLLSQGADKTIRNFSGMSPYDFAVQKNDLKQSLMFFVLKNKI